MSITHEDIVVAFPWPRGKEKVLHPEQIAAGGIWSIVHAMRSLGRRVFLVNLYDEKNQFNDERAALQLKHTLRHADPTAMIVFDFGNSRVDWRSVSPKMKSVTLAYHAGDDPMRNDANRDTIRSTNYDLLMTAQKPFVEKYSQEFETMTAWVPYWSDHLLHFQRIGQEKVFDVIACSKIYGLREAIFKAIIKSSISFKHDVQFGHAYSSMLSMSRIGLHHAWCGEVGYRHFEIPHLGLPLVCDELDESYGLRELLGDLPFYYNGKTDEEKVENCVRTVRNLLDYLNDPLIVQRVDSLRRLVLNNHTSMNRAKQILEFVSTVNTIPVKREEHE